MVDGQGRGWFFRKRILCARESSHGIFVLFLFVVLREFSKKKKNFGDPTGSPSSSLVTTSWRMHWTSEKYDVTVVSSFEHVYLMIWYLLLTVTNRTNTLEIG
jgi:hypothetical protein